VELIFGVFSLVDGVVWTEQRKGPGGGVVFVLVNGVSYGLNSGKDEEGGWASIKPHGPLLTLLRKQGNFIDQSTSCVDKEGKGGLFPEV
jgi:hypothetical protein